MLGLLLAACLTFQDDAAATEAARTYAARTAAKTLRKCFLVGIAEGSHSSRTACLPRSGDPGPYGFGAYTAPGGT